MAPRNRNLTPDGGEFRPVFNFATAKNSIVDKTPRLSSTLPTTIKPRFDGEMTQASFGTPWRVLAMMAARLVQGGNMPAKMGAAFNVARNMPRGPVAAKLGASLVRASVKEAENLLAYKPSTLFTSGFSASPAQASEYYRALAKIMGRTSNQFPMELRPLIRATGSVLKNESRKLGR
jgi:hypothetical protein